MSFISLLISLLSTSFFPVPPNPHTTMIKITEKPIDAQKVIETVSSLGAGLWSF